MSTYARVLILSVLAIVLAGAGAVWFLANFAYQDVETEGHYSPQARKNPYLALTWFLREMGIDAESVSGRELLDALPPPDDVLYLPHSRTAFNDRRREALLGWMSAGGNLITVVHEDWNEETERSGEPFFDDFGIRRYRFEAEEDDVSEAPGDSGTVSGDDRQFTSVSITDYPATLQVRFSRDAYLWDASETVSGWVGDGRGAVLLQYEVGEGSLTVVADDGFWVNSGLGERDHGLFAFLLMAPDTGRVWIMYDISMPALTSLVWDRAPYAVCASLVLLAVLLWGLYDRFGPLAVSGGVRRRSLMEHLGASARYQWRIDRAATLLHELRDSISSRLEQVHPDWPRMQPDERLEWLSQRSGRDVNSLAFALHGDVSDERGFLAVVRELQHIGKSI